jgi:pyruvate dehydrogenase E1 component alpha subunit
MDGELLLGALRWMTKSRLYDHRVIALQRQGRFGVYSPGTGQEASIIGSAMALDAARDWIVPQYRELMATVYHGLPLEVISAQYLGKIGPARIPDHVRVLPSQVSIAAHLPHAVGLAWGLRIQGTNAVVLAYIGEGGSSEGDFHESLNLAGVTRAPVIFFLQNNQWAISTSRRVQSATSSFALRAAGYGFEGFEVDGNDVMAVHEVVVAAVDRARKGAGPTLIEAVTYRMGFHNTTDNPSRYQDPEEHRKAGQRDPIQRVQKYLTSMGMWDDSRQAQLVNEVQSEIDTALEVAQGMPEPGPQDLFDNIYERPPARVLRQHAEFLDGLPR